MIPPYDRAADGKRRLPGAEGQSVRLRDHEDQRDLRGFPRALSVASPATRTCSKAGRSCSTAPTIITSASTIPRSASTRTASSSSAAPGRSAGRARPKWSTCSRPMRLIQQGIMSLPTHRRRAPVRHLGQPVDPQRVAGKRGGRRARLAAHRRHDPHRSERAAAATRWSTTPRSRGARRDGLPAGPRERTRPGKNCTARRSGQLGEGGVMEFARQISRHVEQDAAAQSLSACS